MALAAPVTVTLAMASGPGFPEGSPEHRYELRVVLDPRGGLDAEAWAADGAAWPARRLWPGGPVLEGDVQHDPDNGWSLRFFGAAAEGPDAPLQNLIRARSGLRPGEYMTIVEPDGREYSYRIVGMG